MTTVKFRVVVSIVAILPVLSLVSVAEVPFEPLSAIDPAEMGLKRFTLAFVTESKLGARIIKDSRGVRVRIGTFTSSDDGIGFSTNPDGWKLEARQVLDGRESAAVAKLVADISNYAFYYPDHSDPKIPDHVQAGPRSFPGFEITNGRGFVRFRFSPVDRFGCFSSSDGKRSGYWRLSKEFTEAMVGVCKLGKTNDAQQVEEAYAGSAPE